MNREYKQAPAAKTNFEEAMKAVFQVPKLYSNNKKEQDKPAPTVKKLKSSDYLC